jgi:hypothetical protein
VRFSKAEGEHLDASPLKPCYEVPRNQRALSLEEYSILRELLIMLLLELHQVLALHNLSKGLLGIGVKFVWPPANLDKVESAF